MIRTVYKVLFTLIFISLSISDVFAFNYINDYKKQVDSVLATLSLRQKVAQLFIIDVVSGNSKQIKEIQNYLVAEEGVGGIIIMRDRLIGAVNRINELHELAKLPLLVSIDGEWGVSMRYKEVPEFPRQMQLGALSNDSLVYKMGYAIGKECNMLNIHVNFAPDIDINNNPNNPVINTRSFGEDKHKVAIFGTAYMQGMKDAGVAGSAKHFPGHGDTNVDSHKALPSLPFTRERLDSLELYPFKYLINNGVDMVMVGHLDVPCYDQSKRPASISHKIITGLLRDELAYNGIICTDALNMDGVAKFSGLDKKYIPLEAYKAGADILLMAQDVENAITLIVDEIKSGKLSEYDLDNRVRKILALKASKGLFNKSYKPTVSTYRLSSKIIKEENIELINTIAQHSVTLLWNKENREFNYLGDDFTYPLSEREYDFVGDNTPTYLPLASLYNKKVALVLLPNSTVNSNLSSFISDYKRLDTVIYLPAKVNKEILENSKRLLKNYDLVITAFENTDSRAKRNFGIDTAQMSFFNNWAGEQDMIVLYFGSPYALNTFSTHENFKAFLLAYSVTSANSMAATQAIFGAIPCLGVLPVATGEFKCNSSVILNKTVRPRFTTESKPNDSNALKSIILSKMSLPLTLFPLVGRLIDNNEFKTTTFIGDILSTKDKLTVLDVKKRKIKEQTKASIVEDGKNFYHNNIILWDIMSQHSGLPQVGDNFIYTLDNLSKLELSKAAEPVYSNVNAYYLYKIIDKYYNNPKQEIIDHTNKLFTKLEMYDSSIDNNLNIITNKLDLQKFKFAVDNNGYYAGEQVFSKATANIIKSMWQYYLAENDL